MIPFGLGVFLGIVLMTRGLEYAMQKYPQLSYLIILGFVIGSLWEVFPGVLEGMEWIVCILMAVIGFAFIFSLSKNSNL